MPQAADIGIHLEPGDIEALFHEILDSNNSHGPYKQGRLAEAILDEGRGEPTKTNHGDGLRPC